MLIFFFLLKGHICLYKVLHWFNNLRHINRAKHFKEENHRGIFYCGNLILKVLEILTRIETPQTSNKHSQAPTRWRRGTVCGSRNPRNLLKKFTCKKQFSRQTSAAEETTAGTRALDLALGSTAGERTPYNGGGSKEVNYRWRERQGAEMPPPRIFLIIFFCGGESVGAT